MNEPESGADVSSIHRYSTLQGGGGGYNMDSGMNEPESGAGVSSIHRYSTLPGVGGWGGVGTTWTQE